MKTRHLLLFILFIFSTTLLAQKKKGKEESKSSLLWEVSGNGLKEPSYLFGTFHLLNEQYLNSQPGWKDKFDKSTAVMVEMVMDSAKLPLMFSKMMTQDSTLDKLLSPEEYKVAADWFKEVSGMDLKMLNNAKPVTLSMMLTIYTWAKLKPEDYNPAALSMDIFFEQNARKTNKSVEPFETIEEQLALLYDNISIKRQNEMLQEFLQDRKKSEGEILKMDECYRSGDLECLKNLITTSQSYQKEEMDKMINQRNKNWMTKIKTSIKAQPSFIAVGAGHLPGEDGLINLLRKEGFKVVPLPMKP